MLKIKKNKVKELAKYGFLQNDSKLFDRYLYINKCNTIQNRIFVYKDLHLRFGNINQKVLNTLYDMIQDGIVEKVE